MGSLGWEWDYMSVAHFAVFITKEILLFQPGYILLILGMTIMSKMLRFGTNGSTTDTVLVWYNVNGYPC